MNTFERRFDAFCEKTGIDPVRLLPNIKVPKTVRQMGTRHNTETKKITEIDMPFTNIYELLWLWCWRRDEEKQSRWEWFWGFLYEVSIGVYTPKKFWVPVDVEVKR